MVKGGYALFTVNHWEGLFVGNGQEGMVFEMVRVANESKKKCVKNYPFIEKLDYKKMNSSMIPQVLKTLNEFFIVTQINM